MSKKKFLDLTGLQEYDKGVKNALDNKADKDHTHDFSHNHDDRYAKINHTHNNLSDKNHVHDNRYYTETETDNLLDNKADKVHNHDDRYYTKTESDNRYIPYYTEEITLWSDGSDLTTTISIAGIHHIDIQGDSYDYSFPSKTGTLALLEDIPNSYTKTESDSKYLPTVSFTYNGPNAHTVKSLYDLIIESAPGGQCFLNIIGYLTFSGYISIRYMGSYLIYLMDFGNKKHIGGVFSSTESFDSVLNQMTTLATTSDLDSKLINYVDLTSTQTITGQKTFVTIYADSVGYFGSTSAFSFNSEGTPTIINKNGSYFCFMDDSNGEYAGDTFMYTLPYQSGTIALTSDIDGKADKDHTHKEISYSYNGSYNKFTFTDVGDPCVVNKRGRILSISNDTNDTGYYDYTFPEKDGMVVVMNDGCITREEYEYQFPYLTGTVMIAEETASYEIGKLTLYETLEVYSDNDSEIIEGHGFGDHDIDATYSARGILIYDNDGSGSNREYHLCYPAYKSGTFALTNVDNAFSVTQNITGNDDTPLNLKANHGSMSNIAFFNSSGTRLGNIGVKEYKPYFWAGSGTSGEIALTSDFKTINGQSIVGSGNISISGGGSSEVVYENYSLYSTEVLQIQLNDKSMFFMEFVGGYGQYWYNGDGSHIITIEIEDLNGDYPVTVEFENFEDDGQLEIEICNGTASIYTPSGDVWIYECRAPRTLFISLDNAYKDDETEIEFEAEYVKKPIRYIGG